MKSLALAVLALCFLGCPPREEDTSPEGDTDSDSDSDSDTDADTDTDTDTDTDADLTIVGEITYVTTDFGKPVCDSVIALTGTPFTGDCLDCDFAFYIDAEVTKEAGTKDCVTNPIQSFLEGEAAWFANPILMFFEYYSLAWQNLIVTGFYYYGYGPYLYIDVYEGMSTANGGASVDWDGTNLDWSYNLAYISYSSTASYVYDCGTLEASTSTEDYGGEWSVTGAIKLGDPRSVDVWSFVIDTADTDRFAISIDTTDGSTASDLVAVVNDPSGCSVMRGDNNFDCTFEPPRNSCPSMFVSEAEAGTWQVVVYWSGRDEVAEYGNYEITMNTEYDPLLTAVADDVGYFPITADVSTEVIGSVVVQ